MIIKLSMFLDSLLNDLDFLNANFTTRFWLPQTYSIWEDFLPPFSLSALFQAVTTTPQKASSLLSGVETSLLPSLWRIPINLGQSHFAHPVDFVSPYLRFNLERDECLNSGLNRAHLLVWLLLRRYKQASQWIWNIITWDKNSSSCCKISSWFIVIICRFHIIKLIFVTKSCFNAHLKFIFFYWCRIGNSLEGYYQ